MGKAMSYQVDLVDPEADRAGFPDADRVLPELPPDDAACAPAARAAGLFAVVATMGQRDEEALLAALRLEPSYLGVVASRRRFAEMGAALAARGVARTALERVRNPAGLDIGAKTPEEIALSIFAEIVQGRRSRAERLPDATEARAAGGTEIDPICGMTVVVAGARHTAEHAGRTWYFCNPRCRERFLATPERWAAAMPGAAP
jgi:xanthine dehydrogenase accessory factor